MASVHDHAHGPHVHVPEGRALAIAVAVASAILAAEVAGGLVAHSLAVLSDAGHMLTDVLALALAWWATQMAGRPPTPRRSYGFHRAGILTALLNAALLILVAAGILLEAGLRLRHPVPVRPAVMWAVAAVGLVGNLVLSRSLGHHQGGDNLNVHAAWLHVIGDAAASAAVLVAGVVIALTGWLWVDPALSAAIALLIAVGAARLVRQTVDVLMEGTPSGIAPADVVLAIRGCPAVLSVHHVHIWSLGNGHFAMSGHLVVRDGPLSSSQIVRTEVEGLLRDQFRIGHCTLQVESDREVCAGSHCAARAEGDGNHAIAGRQA